MSSCERCWSMGYDPYGSQSDRYQENIRAHTCTPEQQAGRDALKCPKCDRWSIHQYTYEPMCGCVLGSMPQRGDVGMGETRTIEGPPMNLHNLPKRGDNHG